MGRRGGGSDRFRTRNQGARRAIGRARERERRRPRGSAGPPILDPLALSGGESPRAGEGSLSRMERAGASRFPLATRLLVVVACIAYEGLLVGGVPSGLATLVFLLGIAVILLKAAPGGPEDHEDVSRSGRPAPVPPGRRRRAWRLSRSPPPASLPRPEDGGLGDPVEDPYPLELLEPDAAEQGRCPFCSCALDGGAVWVCDRCETPHHAECWRSAGRCTTYACGSKRYRRLSVPDREPGPAGSP